MTGRLVALCSALVALALLAGCGTTSTLSSISVTPATASIPGVGSTAQFQAIGTFSNGKKNTSYTQTLTTQVTWSSSVDTVATVNSSGVATGVSAGTTTITATGGNGSLQGSATLTVGTASGPSHNLVSLTVIPAPFMQAVNQEGETAQFIAIGTFTGTPATEDLTDQVSWTSSDVRIATINSAGLATAVGSCGQFQQVTNITAIAPPSTGGAVGTSNLTVAPCGVNNLPTLTVYEVGQGTGTVTSVPPGINCGSGAGCTANFTLGAQVTLTAAPAPESTFGGWSANCVPDNQPTCSITMPNNETVGAIFNLAQ